jgi:hypothetical protein
VLARGDDPPVPPAFPAAADIFTLLTLHP